MIALDYAHLVHDVLVDVRFTTAVYGVHAAGTVYRMDEVPIPLRPLLPSPFPTDEEVLSDLEVRVRGLRADSGR